MGQVVGKAEKGEVVILEVFDQPLFVSKSFLLTPVPCCSEFKRFNVSKFRFTSLFSEIVTSDGRSSALECKISYNVDQDTGNDTLKAYKFVNRSLKTEMTKAKLKCSREDMTDTNTAESALCVTRVIGDCLVGQAMKMTFKQIMENKELLIEIVFRTAFKILQMNGIHLDSLDLHNIALILDRQDSISISST
uniref:Uncharacterized protein n=1 Tax=Clytia hemisphaerica TaxID=252671 RepID=A0A7M5XF14_9CNID